MKAFDSTRFWMTWLSGLLIALFLFYGNGSRPLANPDEGRYSEIPREMVVSRDYLTPRLNGVKYFEKPPLFYWLQASAIKAFGHSEWALRFWNVFMAISGCLIIFWAGNHFFSWRTGLLGAWTLASTLLYYGISRIVILDMSVSVFITGALLFMLAGCRATAPPRQRGFFRLGYIFCALATLTKGIIGFGIPGAIVLLWVIWTRQWPLIRRLLLPSGIFLFLFITVPWHLLVSLKNPEFAWFYFIHEHFLRLGTKVHHRFQPWWFFIPIFLGGLFPWLTVFVTRLWSDIKSRNHFTLSSEVQFLYLWIGFVLVLYSFSQSKLIPYILPVMPAVALLIGKFFDDCLSNTHATSLTPAFFSQFLLSIALCVTCFWISLPPHVSFAMIKVLIFLFSGLIIGGSLIAWLSAHNKKLLLAFGALCISTLIGFAVLQQITPSLQRPTTKFLATALKPHLTPTTPVICFEFYPQELPFYLQRTVHIYGWSGELSFGASVEDMSHRLLSQQRLNEMWESHEQAYLFVREDALSNLYAILKSPFHILSQHFNVYLIAKKPTRIS